MAETTDLQNKTAEKTWKRRGLFAAAAAFVAGVVTRVSEQQVQAGTDGDVVLGAANTTTGFTSITCTTPNSNGFTAMCKTGSNDWGLAGIGSRFGVRGFAQPATTDPNAFGVSGDGAVGARGGVVGADGNTTAIGGGSFGVAGVSLPGYGVYGLVPPQSSANTIAIYAQNYSTYTGPGPGAGGFAIYGLCANGHGLVGATAAAGAAAVVGASNGVVGAYAATFFGPVVVGGPFTVVGGPKSAAVPHPDGMHRRLYCMESPESWFEDFGKGQLACGQADITLDPDFAAMVHLDDYHVFLTPYGGSDVMAVTDRTERGFHVAVMNETSDAAFSWRVVARRKDIAAPRFETVEVPPEPQMPNVPESILAPELRRLEGSAHRKG